MVKLKNLSLMLFFTVFINGCAVHAVADALSSTAQLDINSRLVSWGEDAGVIRLEESKYKKDFFKLANNFESQTNKLFCGPTSAAIVLNSLRIRKAGFILPEDPSLLGKQDLHYLAVDKWSPVYKRYTQNNVFLKSPKLRAQVLGKPQVNAKGLQVKDHGFQIHQLAQLFAAHGLDVKLRIVSDKLENQFIKNELVKNMGDPDDYVVVNYQRSQLQQQGGGHISPLGAYHKPTDSFLIMDVTPNKADWVWVKADLLIAAMRTFDTVENRGYLLLKEGAAD